MRNPLDLDVEQFNPAVTREYYESLGYKKSVVDAMLTLDALIYERPVHEIREAVREEDNDSD